MSSAVNRSQPYLFIVFGLPGSGKSYFASRWAERTRATYINSDILRKQMFPSPAYSSEEKKLVYERILLVTKKAVSEGKDIVLDATFHTDDLRRLFKKEISASAVLHFIEIVSDESTIRQRLKEKRLYSDADYNVYLHIKHTWQALDQKHLILYSSNNNINEMLENAERYFGISGNVTSSTFSC